MVRRDHGDEPVPGEFAGGDTLGPGGARHAEHRTAVPAAVHRGRTPARRGGRHLDGGHAPFVLWFQGIGGLPVTSAAVLGLLSPLVAAVLGAVLLGQTPGPVQLVGFGLALAAIVAGQLPAPGRPAARPAPAGSGRRGVQSCGGREPSWWSATFRASSTSRRRCP
ncbi:DMT family transporter [Streptomyces sp. NPDC058049]|uniref:DMT family transporter n=1 Tax=Streptomyces sp. NPDC058049 TaxID=3346314 RepID=UPI0036F00127